MKEILNILYEFLFSSSDPNMTYGIAAQAIAAGIQGLGSVVSGIFASGRAKRAQRRAAAERKKLTGELNSLEKGRQAVINPYDNFTNLSSLAKDLSGKLSNPYASLGVATAGAEIQIEEADIALANTLDTLRATGASAGGATALAQAALQSKKGVAASIEQQEAQNEKLRAQGQAQLERMQMQEGIRVQQTQLSEGQRMQQADAMGRTFEFNAREKRKDDKINYTRNQLGGAKAQENAAYNQRTAAIGSAIMGVAGAAGDMAATGAFGGTTPSTAATGPNAPASSSNPTGYNQFTQMQNQFTNNLISGKYDINVDTSVGSFLNQNPITSDRRLKKNIRQYGQSLSGINIYLFEYKDKKYGKGVYQGVMSDEIPQYAVVKHSDGFDRVDYSKLDVEFKQI